MSPCVLSVLLHCSVSLCVFSVVPLWCLPVCFQCCSTVACLCAFSVSFHCGVDFFQFVCSTCKGEYHYAVVVGVGRYCFRQGHWECPMVTFTRGGGGGGGGGAERFVKFLMNSSH